MMKKRINQFNETRNVKLIKMMERAGLKDKVIAQKIGISPVWLSKIKNGKCVPKETISKLENFLNEFNNKVA